MAHLPTQRRCEFCGTSCVPRRRRQGARIELGLGNRLKVEPFVQDALHRVVAKLVERQGPTTRHLKAGRAVSMLQLQQLLGASRSAASGLMIDSHLTILTCAPRELTKRR